MRDITKDLEERIEAKKRDRARYQNLVAESEGDLTYLERLLEQERLRLASTAQADITRAPSVLPTLSLEEFIIKTVRAAPKTKEEIKSSAEIAGYFAPGDGSAGRVIHAQTLNLVRNHKLVKLASGAFAHRVAIGTIKPITLQLGDLTSYDDVVERFKTPDS